MLLAASSNILDHFITEKELQKKNGLLSRNRLVRFEVGTRFQIAMKPVNSFRGGKTILIGAKVSPVASKRNISVEVVDYLQPLFFGNKKFF